MLNVYVKGCKVFPWFVTLHFHPLLSCNSLQLRLFSRYDVLCTVQYIFQAVLMKSAQVRYVPHRTWSRLSWDAWTSKVSDRRNGYQIWCSWGQGLSSGQTLGPTGQSWMSMYSVLRTYTHVANIRGCGMVQPSWKGRVFRPCSTYHTASSYRLIPRLGSWD